MRWIISFVVTRLHPTRVFVHLRGKLTKHFPHFTEIYHCERSFPRANCNHVCRWRRKIWESNLISVSLSLHWFNSPWQANLIRFYNWLFLFLQFSFIKFLSSARSSRLTCRGGWCAHKRGLRLLSTQYNKLTVWLLWIMFRQTVNGSVSYVHPSSFRLSQSQLLSVAAHMWNGFRLLLGRSSHSDFY